MFTEFQANIYHYLGPALPSFNDVPKFNRIYFLNSQEAIAGRQNLEPQRRLNTELLFQIVTSIRALNLIAQAYKMMPKVIESEKLNATANGRTIPTVRLIFDEGNNFDLRCYNAPTSNEVAAVLISVSDNMFRIQDLLVYSQAGELQRISILNCHCDPMCYRLLLPLGELEWHPRRTRQSGGKMSILQF